MMYGGSAGLTSAPTADAAPATPSPLVISNTLLRIAAGLATREASAATTMVIPTVGGGEHSSHAVSSSSSSIRIAAIEESAELPQRDLEDHAGPAMTPGSGVADTGHLLRDEGALTALHVLHGRSLAAAIGIAFYRNERIVLHVVPHPLDSPFIREGVDSIEKVAIQLRVPELQPPGSTCGDGPEEYHGLVDFSQLSRHRFFFEVGTHVVQPPFHCDCTSFHYQVLTRGEATRCKHLLALDLLATQLSRHRRSNGVGVESLPGFGTGGFYAALGERTAMKSQPSESADGNRSLAAEWGSGGAVGSAARAMVEVQPSHPQAYAERLAASAASSLDTRGARQARWQGPR